MKKSVLIVGLFVLGMASISFGQKKGTGLIRDDAAYKAVPMIEKPLGFGQNLPSSYSLVDYIPSQIGDQGQMGTCAGWSSTYYLASMEYAIKSGIKDKNLINAMVYDPIYTYNNSSSKVDGKDEGCQNGANLDKVSSWLVNNEPKRMNIDEALCGYGGNDFSGSLLDFTDYYRLFDPYSDFEDQISSVCQSLVNGHPVLIGMWFPNSFYDVSSNGVFNSENQSINYDNGHAMTVVGYDDNKLGGCFTVVNSWGSSWGDNGLVYIKYQDFFNYTLYGFSFETEVKNLSSATVGCLTGDCQNGYGVSILKKKTTGHFEGYFSGGKPVKGIYTIPNGTATKRDEKLIKKMLKKGWGTTVTNSYGSTIGAIVSGL